MISLANVPRTDGSNLVSIELNRNNMATIKESAPKTLFKSFNGSPPTRSTWGKVLKLAE